MIRSFFIVLIFFISCTTGKESVMPFRNMAYSGERLFPISTSDAESVIRIWFNNGTSIDRVITVSTDTLFNNQGKLVEFGFVSSKGIFKTKTRDFYKSQHIKPKSGYDSFFKKVDELGIIDYESQGEFQLALHHPFSLYVVEYKKGNKYGRFSFRSSMPREAELNNKFIDFENFLFEEFRWEFYF